MLKSEQIEDRLKAEIAEAGRTITDPKELVKWMSENGIGRSTMSAATGANYDAVVAKERAGNPYRQTSATDYAKWSLPLTPEHYPGTSTQWADWRPKEILIERLSAALDASDDFWRDIYRRHKGGEPDAAGLAWWKADTEKRFVAGIKNH